jgi:N-acetyl-gamma-glutamyl-phosphate reductase
MVRAKVIGATGYGGIGITELLLAHPGVEIDCLVATQDIGKPICELYPHLEGFCDLPVLSPEHPAAGEPVDVVFFATPDRVGMQHAQAELDRGARVIDYSGDFRFSSASTYETYARRLGLPEEHLAPALLEQAVYGLPELHRVEIAGARLVGNVGCFAAGVILGLAPAVAARLVDLESIICDCKTGVSGAGKKPNPQFHFPARQDAMNAYRLTGHQHLCEIESQLGALAGGELVVTLTTQVVPANRGIMGCLYGDLADGLNYDEVLEGYREFHRNNHFVRIYDRHAAVNTAHVRGTNFCNLVVDVDERTNRLRVISYIDNLMKGQAGNALQNMNLMFEFAETTGLDQPGRYP